MMRKKISETPPDYPLVFKPAKVWPPTKQFLNEDL